MDESTARRLTDLDRKALGPYFQAVAEAMRARDAAFTTLVMAKGIDPEQFDCSITPDGEAFVVTRKQGVPPEGAPAGSSDAQEAARRALQAVRGDG